MRSGGLGPARGLAAPCAPRSRYSTLRPAGSPPPKASLLRHDGAAPRAMPAPDSHGKGIGYRMVQRSARLWRQRAAPFSDWIACGRQAPETTGATPSTTGPPIPGKAGDEPPWVADLCPARRRHATAGSRE
jgi:hypothetical protein